jgi:hypothetical protein
MEKNAKKCFQEKKISNFKFPKGYLELVRFHRPILGSEPIIYGDKCIKKIIY